MDEKEAKKMFIRNEKLKTNRASELKNREKNG